MPSSSYFHDAVAAQERLDIRIGVEQKLAESVRAVNTALADFKQSLRSLIDEDAERVGRCQCRKQQAYCRLVVALVSSGVRASVSRQRRAADRRSAKQGRSR